ncbi:unannotated protein [freshwater metagenome]|uniref:Unannotated protein n=1 Tax=freshwater metagenome TaxID=449393 RepID=A0A6J6WSP9_9ZZZZ
MTSPLALVPPILSKTIFPRRRPDSTDFSPTYGPLTPTPSPLNWTIGVPALMIALRPFTIDAAGTEVAIPSTPEAAMF